MCVIRVQCSTNQREVRRLISNHPLHPEKWCRIFPEESKSIVVASAMGFAQGQTCPDAKKLTNSSLANWAG